MIKYLRDHKDSGGNADYALDITDPYSAGVMANRQRTGPPLSKREFFGMMTGTDISLDVTDDPKTPKLKTTQKEYPITP